MYNERTLDQTEIVMNVIEEADCSKFGVELMMRNAVAEKI